MQSEKDSVAIAFVRQALACAQARGVAPETVLRGAGIAPALLLSDEARVTSTSFGRLWLAIARALDDEFFGLDSRRMKLGSFATLCHLAVHTATLGEALERIAGFFNIVLDDLRVELHAGGAEARIDLVGSGRAGAAAPANRVFAHETLLVMLLGLMSWLCARRIAVAHAEFAYPAPAWWREYLVIYSGQIAFDAAVTSVAFSPACLKLKVVQSERSLADFLREAPGNFILKYRDDRSVSARVRRHLRATAPAAWPAESALARELGMGASSLRRKLAAEGATFRGIKDMLRRDIAIRQLTHTGAGVADIAHALGFAEPSAFHRAFRQWTGVRPGDYRRGLVGTR